MNNENNTKDLNSCTPDEIEAWQSCIKSAIFSDLIALRELDERAFNELFSGRENEIAQFYESLDVFCRTGRNYLIVGEAGIGKSSFLFKIFLNEYRELRSYVYPIYIDFRKGALSRDSALINFIDKIDRYFDDVGFPINTLQKPKESNTIDYNLIKVSEHLTKYNPVDNNKFLMLLVDDLDYADDFWLEFLLAIHNLVTSPKISFVLSLRPLLEYKIRTENDVLYRDIIRNTKRIELPALSVKNTLYKRLAPIIGENDELAFYNYIKRLFRRDSALCRILRKQYGIKDIEQLARFEFPFTQKLMTFMTEMTNGNIREVFDIAEAVLRYIFINSNNLKTRMEDGGKKYIINRESIIDLFWKNKKKYEANYELFNLNEVFSIDENGRQHSVHYNVLEMVKYVGIFDERTFTILERYGHKRYDIVNSLKVLEDRNHRLIVPIRTNTNVRGTRHVGMQTEYKITNKGDKYLEMVEFDDKWECYRNEFGHPGNSIKRML